jgi:hypothetical protein
MTENELLKDCLQRLNQSGVPYYLTGSMASNYWGVPRSTHDLDFVIKLCAEDVATLAAAFQGDFFIQEDSVRGALRPPFQFNALDQRSSLKVDFWVATDDPFAQEMFQRRKCVSLFGVRAWIASAEDVVLHKLLWHNHTPSERQLLDAAGIWAVQAKKLDEVYLSTWAAKLHVEKLFGQIQRGEDGPKTT